jgi:hypothetical protein
MLTFSGSTAWADCNGDAICLGIRSAESGRTCSFRKTENDQFNLTENQRERARLSCETLRLAKTGLPCKQLPAKMQTAPYVEICRQVESLLKSHSNTFPVGGVRTLCYDLVKAHKASKGKEKENQLLDACTLYLDVNDCPDPAVVDNLDKSKGPADEVCRFVLSDSGEARTSRKGRSLRGGKKKQLANRLSGVFSRTRSDPSLKEKSNQDSELNPRYKEVLDELWERNTPINPETFLRGEGEKLVELLSVKKEDEVKGEKVKQESLKPLEPLTLQETRELSSMKAQVIKLMKGRACSAVVDDGLSGTTFVKWKLQNPKKCAVAVKRTMLDIAAFLRSEAFPPELRKVLILVEKKVAEELGSKAAKELVINTLLLRTFGPALLVSNKSSESEKTIKGRLLFLQILQRVASGEGAKTQETSPMNYLIQEGVPRMEIPAFKSIYDALHQR